jgi:hypothetical protein
MKNKRLVIIQDNVKSKDINLVIGRFALSLNENATYEMEFEDGVYLSLSVDELNSVNWGDLCPLHHDDYMIGIISQLIISKCFEYQNTNECIESFQKNHPEEVLSSEEHARSLELPLKELIERFDGLNRWHDKYQCSRLDRALERGDSPSSPAQKKSRAKSLLLTPKYGKFRKTVATKLLDDFQSTYGDKAFHLEPREVAYFIFNGNSFDGIGSK